MTIKHNQTIIDNFLETFDSVKEGLEYLNNRLGTHYRHNAMSNWRTEKERPGVRAYELMVKRVLEENDQKKAYKLIKLDL